MGSDNRQRQKIIGVRVSADEYGGIQAIAHACALTPAALLRQLGLTHQPASRLDQQAIHELARCRGDFGRVGGLLKMWLQSPGRNRWQNQTKIVGLLKRIERQMGEFEEIIKRIDNDRKAD